MIVDTLNHTDCYRALHPRIERAFAYLNEVDLMNVAPGRYEIEGSDLFVNVVEADLKNPCDAKLEVHNDYIDLQLLLCGEESFGWSPRESLQKPCAPFDKERDIQFFDDEHRFRYPLHAGEFTILLPGDAHAPLIGEGRVRKAIFKIKL